VYIKPRRPRLNGKVERSLRIDEEEFYMSDKLGTLEPGKLADVVLIDGKPDKNLDDPASVDLVIRDSWIIVE